MNFLAWFRRKPHKMFLSEDEIVADMLSRMDDADRETWLKTTRDELISGHNTTGRNIRNYYKLWDSDNPHVVFEPANHDKFPDQFSQRVIERVWDAVNIQAEGEAGSSRDTR